MDSRSPKNGERVDTMTTSKMTNKIALTTALSYVPEHETEVREKLQKMLEQVEKRSASPKKLTDTQKQNVEFGKVIADGMQDGEKRTVSDMIKTIPGLEGLSTQRVSPIVARLVDEKILDKVSIKNRSYFVIAGAEVEGD